MSAQMLAAASKEIEVTGLFSALPLRLLYLLLIKGESLDEMKLLEEQARRIAEEAKSEQPKPKSMTFVK